MPTARSDAPAAAAPAILRGDERPELLRDETLADVFAATVRDRAAAVAIVDGARSLTYGDVDAASRRLAAALVASGLGGRGKRIGLWCARGADALIAQIAIARCGAAWLPFDGDAPAERVAAALAEAGATGLLHDREALDPAIALTARRARELPSGDDAALAACVPRPDDVAYVIATSGTTGRPKAIAIAHRAICHFLRSENALLGVAAHDRVYHGFSLAFDMSFEEVWITWLAGAALWIAPKPVTVDPDAVARALAEQRISVLHAVPSLVALLPELPAAVRLVNLGGEACPQPVCDRWADGARRVVNTYGPTETTVSATLAELRRGVAVTIGRPLPNYGAVVLGEDGGPVACGEAGELAVFGPGLAVGYVGRDELTRERFPTGPFPSLPGVARLYRTGDRAVIGDDGEIRFHGRVDDQVKVRGFRLELGEVEAALTRVPGVRAAAVVTTPSGDRLSAFVVGDAPASRLRQELATSLPSYAVPSAFVALDALPRLPSGKVDRRALAALTPAPGADGPADDPATPAERAVAAAIAALFPGRAFRRGDDFFADLGGHSLLAARFVSRLRAEHGFAGAGVALVYAQRTLGAIAAALPAPPAVAAIAVDADAIAARRRRRIRCGLAQLALFPLPLGVHLASWLAPFFAYHLLTGDDGDSIALAVMWSCLVFVASLVVEFVVALIVKRTVGRLAPGRYPLWGLAYLRWWFAHQMEASVPTYLLNGTPLYRAWLRLNGARIGRDVAIGSLDVGAPELLTIGDGAAIGTSVLISNARVERGELFIDRVAIGARAVIDAYAVVEGGAQVGDGAVVGPLALVPAGARVDAATRVGGIPARALGAEPPPARPPHRPSALRRLGEAALYPIAAFAIATLFFVPVFPGFMLMDWLDAHWLDAFEGEHVAVAAGVYLVLGVPAAATLVLATLACAAALRWLVRPRVRAGTWPIHGAMYYSRWLSVQIQENSLHLLHGLFATVYAPLWLRLIGARVGRHAEISNALGIAPELLALGDDSFVADGAVVGDEQVRDGRFTLLGTAVGSRTFIGNGACVPDGSRLPDDVLVGVQSLAPDNRLLAPGQTWLGNPPLALPARERAIGLGEHLTFRPTAARRLSRGVIEALRIVLPQAFLIAFGYVAVFLIVPAFEDGDWLRGLAELTVAGFAYGVVCFAAVLCAKWLLIGRYRPRQDGMWTCFVWLSEAVTSIYESLAVPNFLAYLRGTPWLPAALRLFGARIGRGTWLNTTDLTEFDCVEIGDDAELDDDCGPQTHLFEDRVMKIGRVRLGRRVSIGARAIVLYDTEVGDDARLAALTLVAKGERLPAATSWIGSPAAPGSAP